MRKWNYLVIVALVWASAARAENPVIVAGKTRLTVITPNLVRIEYSPQGMFIDNRSMFAANRESRFGDFKLTRDAKTLTVETPALRLSYTDDGNAPGAENLKAEVRFGAKEWRPVEPTGKNPGNLGGTVRTLDTVSGPIDLGKGVLSRDGWYLLDDSKSALLTDDWVKARPEGGTDWYFFGYGTDYAAALKSLTAVGGPVPMPRKYALGAWYSRYWPYTSDDFKQIVRDYGDHGFPLDMIVMDMDWHLVPEKVGWTGYTWNTKLIPDPKELLSWFHSNGLHVTLNDHPALGVQPHEEMYDTFMKAMGLDPAGKETVPFDAGDKRYLDTFWNTTHVPREKEGVDFWWLDWQQYPGTRSIPELTNLAWLNRYYFTRAMRDNLRGISFSRWAGWGDHRHPIQFSGDAHTNWEMLAFQVPMTSTAGNVGCFFWSHDIGGHNGARIEESYTRWCQFGALSAALRSHPTRDAKLDRRPWTYPDWAEASMRTSWRLRSELFPYIYSGVAQASRDTIPLLRPMYLSHPDDENAYRNPQQYMFGDDLLVAPIVTPGKGPGRIGQQVVWFPKGTWFNYFTGERIEGDTERLVSAAIDEFPLYFRGGAPIAMQAYSPRMTSAKLDSLVIRCYPGESGSSMLYEDDGVTVAYTTGASATTQLDARRKGDVTTLTINPTKGTYDGQIKTRACVVVLPGLGAPKSAAVDGKPVKPEYDQKTCTVTIRVPTREIGATTTISVTAPLADFAAISEQAIGAREKDYGADPMAYYASRGVGLVKTVDEPSGYGPAKGMRFYAPPGVIDGDAFEVVYNGRQARGKAGNSSLLVPPTASVDSVMTFADEVRVTFKVKGKAIALEQRLPTYGALKSAGNLARSAKVTVSSTDPRNPVSGVIDGSPTGFPIRSDAEWSTKAEKSGAWVRLTWETPQTLSRIALFDRPNDADQVTSGTLQFSDGSAVKVGELPNDGATPQLVKFAPRTVTWVQFRVDATSEDTRNIGLSEFAAFGPGK